MIEIDRAGSVITLGALDPEEGDTLENAHVAMLSMPAQESPHVLHVARTLCGAAPAAWR